MSDMSTENPLSEIVMSFPQAMEEEPSVRSASKTRLQSLIVVPSNTTFTIQLSKLWRLPSRKRDWVVVPRLQRKLPAALFKIILTIQQSPNTKNSYTPDESLTVVTLAQRSSDILSSSKLVRAKNLPQAPGEKAGSGPALIDLDYPAKMHPSPIPVSSPQKRTDEQSDRSVERGRHRSTVAGTNTTTGLSSMDAFVEEEGPTGYRGPRTRSRVAVEARIPPANRLIIATPQNLEAKSSKEIRADTQLKRKRVTDEEKRKRELEKEQKKNELEPKLCRN